MSNIDKARNIVDKHLKDSGYVHPEETHNTAYDPYQVYNLENYGDKYGGSSGYSTYGDFVRKSEENKDDEDFSGNDEDDDDSEHQPSKVPLPQKSKVKAPQKNEPRNQNCE